MSTRGHRQDLAYVLHSRAYRNTSLIIDVLTRDSGRLALVAKGARRGNNPLVARLQPYSRLFIEWGGRGELLTLYKAEVDATFVPRIEDDVLYHGFYLNELLIRLLHPHDAHPQLFDDYSRCLQGLTQSQHKDIPLRYFELNLLETLGYGMNLLQDAQDEETVQQGEEYYYQIELGPVKASLHKTDSIRISGETLLALSERNLMNDKHRNEAKRLMRAVLEHYLGGRPLKARELMRSRRLLQHSTSNSG